MDELPFAEIPMPADAEVRLVALALMRRGHYEYDDGKYRVSIEDPDTVEWMRTDAEHLVERLHERGRTFRVAWDALVDTGLHDPTQAREMACLADDVRAIIDMLTSPRRVGTPS